MNALAQRDATEHPDNEAPRTVEIPPYVVVVETERPVSNVFNQRLGQAYRAQEDPLIDTSTARSHTFEFRSAVSMWNFARKAVTIAEEMSIVDFCLDMTTAPPEATQQL